MPLFPLLRLKDPRSVSKASSFPLPRSQCRDLESLADGHPVARVSLTATEIIVNLQSVAAARSPMLAVQADQVIKDKPRGCMS